MTRGTDHIAPQLLLCVGKLAFSSTLTVLSREPTWWRTKFLIMHCIMFPIYILSEMVAHTRRELTMTAAVLLHSLQPHSRSLLRCWFTTTCVSEEIIGAAAYLLLISTYTSAPSPPSSTISKHKYRPPYTIPPLPCKYMVLDSFMLHQQFVGWLEKLGHRESEWLSFIHHEIRVKVRVYRHHVSSPPRYPLENPQS